MSQDLEPTTGIVEELHDIEQAGLLSLKGYSYVDIGSELGITPVKAKSLTEKYRDIVRHQAATDPDFMDRVQENTIMFLRQFEDLSKEVWETVKIATDSGSIAGRTNALKLVLDVKKQHAVLLQLMGGKTDASYMARMAKAENVNTILAFILKDIVSHCDNCRPEASKRLAEAFAVMGNTEDALDAEPYEYAEIIDE